MRLIISRLKNTPKTPMEKSETYIRVYGLNISRNLKKTGFFFIYSPKNCFVKKKIYTIFKFYSRYNGKSTKKILVDDWCCRAIVKYC